MASCDLGNLGPVDGEPIDYYWNPLNHCSGLLPWLLLGAAFIFCKENRRTSALWMLLPLIVSGLAWSGFTQILGMPSSTTALINPVIYSLLIALALIWLLGERIGRRHRLATWFLGLLIFATLAGLLLLNIGLGDDAIQIMIFYGIMVAVLLLSLVIAGLWGRKKPGPVRFIFKLSTCILLTLVTLVLGMVSLHSGISLRSIALQVLLSALACAGVMIALLLPLELLLMIHPFWRERFEAVMGIPACKRKEVLPETEEPHEESESCAMD